MNHPEESAESGLTKPGHPRLVPLRDELMHRIRREEAAHGLSRTPPDTLAGHLERVAALARRLAVEEGVDPFLAELAGLFHDAGKFHGGRYHADDQPEEEHAVEVLRDLGFTFGLDPATLESVGQAIQQLYRDDASPSLLSQVLFDADNLDKLGLPGMALYFIKAGLRGRGLSADLIVRLSVELTYARYASCGLYTQTARALADRRAEDTIRFIEAFLDSLRQDGLFDARVECVRVCDLEVDVVTPAACPCGASLGLKHWVEKGKKCTEIHLELTCEACANRHEIRFCRPRLIV